MSVRSEPTFSLNEEVGPLGLYQPVVLSGGRFVATWSSGANIVASIFKTDGTALRQNIVLNAGLASTTNENASITELSNGRFAASWVKNNPGDGSGSAIHTRVFDASGNPIGQGITVNTTTANDQFAPDVTALSNGRFVVTWVSDLTGPDANIRARIVDSSGRAVSKEFAINTTRAEDQREPSVTTLADGRFVVAWTGESGSKVRMFNADGTAVSKEIDVTFRSGGSHSIETVDALPDGGFVVQGGRWARVFNEDGATRGHDFNILHGRWGYFTDIDNIVALADGRLLVTTKYTPDTWYDEPITYVEPYLYRGHLYTNDGKLIGEIDLGQGHSAPHVAALSDGRFVVNWQVSNGASPGSFAKVYDPKIGYALHDWHGGNMADRIHGNVYNNKLWGNGGNDIIWGNGGNDQIWGGWGNDVLYGGAGNDELYGNSGNDRLYGDGGNDRLWGGAGNDLLYGGSGHDTLYGEGGDDRLWGDAGHDRLFGGAGNDFLYGGDGNDLLRGDAGNDRLFGGAGNDTLQGGAGNDIMLGDAGNDRLDGGRGADRLTGGAGADTFVFRAVSESTVHASGRDTILDFSRGEGDKIDLKAIDANTKLGGNQAFNFIGDKAFTKKAGELRYENKGGDTYVYGDVNGDGKADFSILIDINLAMRATDFIL